MNFTTACPREPEVTALLRSGYWPQACPEELLLHAEQCPTCDDRVRLTLAFRGERAQASTAARLELPGVLWWRAQLRRRNAALQRIGRPLLGAQVFAVGLTLVMAAAFLGTQIRQGMGRFTWIGWLEEIPRALHLEALLPSGLQNSAAAAWLVIPSVATLALVSGVIVYVTSEKR